METLLRIVEWIVPACMSFGPLFMIMVARGDTERRSPLTRRVNLIGMGMLVIALMWLDLSLVRQSGKVSLLEQRVTQLEKQIEQTPQACPGDAP
jgi:hypothetical protein